MAMTAEKLAYFRKYREAHKEEVSAARKKYHEAKGFDQYYGNLELTRAVKRKSYYISTGNPEAAQMEQERIDAIRETFPRKKAGRKDVYSAAEKLIRRKACLRKSRYKHVKGLPDLLKEPTTCEICGQSGKMCLDHCHEKNVFRGWICDDCNVAMGKVKDDIGILSAMIEYIKKGVKRMDYKSSVSD